MVPEIVRNHIQELFAQGKPKKKIARQCGIDIKTVRAIIEEETSRPKTRKDKVIVSKELLEQLYARCSGYKYRIYEILYEEYNITVGYSTLTRLFREYEIGKPLKKRSEKYPDIPGDEMQQDTSPFVVRMGDKKLNVVCSGIYFRYSKTRYVKFYPRFDRFLMKCFCHEALTHYGYCAKTCVIDNTNLAVQYGSGSNAVFHPEMR